MKFILSIILATATIATAQLPIVPLVVLSGAGLPTPVAFVQSQVLGNDGAGGVNGYEGFLMAVGSSDFTINSIGRWIISGNSGNETLRVVSVPTGVVMASVVINTSSGTPGTFQYGTLSTAIPLAQAVSYRVVTSTSTTGNHLYDDATTIVPAAIATVTSANYFDSSWHGINGANHTYGPMDFKYTTTNSATKEFLLSNEIAPTGTRHDLTSSLGFKFTVGSSGITVTHLGRWMFSGNSGTHTVAIYGGVSGGTLLASVSVNLSGGSVGVFNYVQLGSPLSLSASTDYYCVSSETLNQDFWSDDPTLYSWRTADATLQSSVFGSAGAWNTDAGNSSYVPPNFKYTKP